jgi:DinB superfamily
MDVDGSAQVTDSSLLDANASPLRSHLLTALQQNRDELFEAIAGLSEEQIAMIPVIGEWTIKDAVGHMAYWEQVIHDHVRESYAEGRPRPMREDETDDVINLREAARRKHWSWARVRAEFENTRRGLIERVEGLSELDLSFQVPNPWWNEHRFYSVAQMIEEDAVGHCREHTEQIKSWKVREQIPDGSGTDGYLSNRAVSSETHIVRPMQEGD